ETAAEIDRMEREGATVVGMTGMPEAALARELGIGYVGIDVVVNQAAGRGDSAQAISIQRIAGVLESAMDKVNTLIDHLVQESAALAGGVLQGRVQAASDEALNSEDGRAAAA